jgi:nucleotidyltransferase substrate binding protein (TIGR01987 family)
MATVIKRISVFLAALKTLEKSINAFYKYRTRYLAHPTDDNEEAFLGMRDSLIQRFEYCTDLIWKVFKDYLEQIEKVDIENSSPRGVMREAIHIGLLSETEGSQCMQMVESRNRTSHIYHVEVAEDIASKVPDYYLLMKKIIDRMQAGIEKK